MARRNRATQNATSEQEQTMANTSEQIIDTTAVANDGVSPDTQTLLERLQAQLAEREAEIARLQASKPARIGGSGRPAKVATLESVLAKQTKTPAKWAILQVAAQVNERVEVGQDEDQAFEQVMSVIRDHAKGVLNVRDQYNSLMEAAWGYLKVAAPKGALSRGIKTPGGAIPAQVSEETAPDEDVEQVADDSADYLQSLSS